MRHGLVYCSSIGDGWTPKFFGEHIVLTKADHAPYMIPIRTINIGDVLPRDTDKQYIVSCDDCSEEITQEEHEALHQESLTEGN